MDIASLIAGIESTTDGSFGFSLTDVILGRVVQSPIKLTQD